MATTTKTHTVELTPDELVLLIEALDSHEYYELTDSESRRYGASMIPDGDSDEIDACRALAHRLEEVRRT